MADARLAPSVMSDLLLFFLLLLLGFLPTPPTWCHVVCSHPWGLGPCGQGLSVQTAHELMHRITSRLPHACAIRNPCAVTHTCQNLLEGFFPILVTAECAVSRIPPRGLWLHTRLARVERGIEIMQVPISHIDTRKEIQSLRQEAA